MSTDPLQEFQTGRGRSETSMPDENAGNDIQTAQSTAAQASERKKFEFHHKRNEIVEWIKTKVELIKVLEANIQEKTDENWKYSSIEDTRSMLEGMVEDIGKITSKESSAPDKCISEEVFKMLDMLRETIIGMLDSLCPSEKRFQSIKVLVTLIQHLSASVGTKVTLEDVQKYIDGKRVMELYSKVQASLQPLVVKMESAKQNIGHGIRKSRDIGKRSKQYSNQVDDIFSRKSTSDLMSMNAKLKAMAEDSEFLLIRYSDTISYLVEKKKSFTSLKKDFERLLGSFLTEEIEDLYRTKF